MYFPGSQSFVGINYGEVADNLPPPALTVKLLQSTTITKLRLYSVNPDILRSLAHTGISVIITASNADIPSLADEPSFSSSWIEANVLPFYPDTAISTISVGNEVFLSKDSNLIAKLLPAMENLQKALVDRSLHTLIRVSTVHPMSVLIQSDPPSSGKFDPATVDGLKPIVAFLQRTAGSFMVNPYPYFAYQSDPSPETLAFCLFKPNKGRVDSGTKLVYRNMFDAQVDAVKWALKGIGFGDVEIVVAETGWPYRGDSGEAGANLVNAKTYNGNLIAHLRSMVGTPVMPGKSVVTYLFAMYDEDLKPGPLSERSFGIYKTDLTPIFDIGLAKTSLPGPPPGPLTGPPPPPQRPQQTTTTRPIPAPALPRQPAVDDCQQPTSSCYYPNTVASHTSSVMNLLHYPTPVVLGLAAFLF